MPRIANTVPDVVAPRLQARCLLAYNGMGLYYNEHYVHHLAVLLIHPHTIYSINIPYTCTCTQCIREWVVRTASYRVSISVYWKPLFLYMYVYVWVCGDHWWKCSCMVALLHVLVYTQTHRHTSLHNGRPS